jgi:hypothetical protein
MEADQILDAALKTTGLPVSRAFRKIESKKPAPRKYITYQIIYRAGELFADDTDEAMESVWRIDLFSKDNYAALVPRITAILKSAEFYGLTVEAETYEDDTGYYHVSFDARYIEKEE